MITLLKGKEENIKEREVIYTFSNEQLKELKEYFIKVLSKINFKEKSLYLKEIDFKKCFKDRDAGRGFIYCFFWGDKSGYSINLTFANGLNSNLFEEQKPYIYFEIFPSATYFKGDFETAYKEQLSLKLNMDSNLKEVKKGFDGIIKRFMKGGLK